VSCNVYDPPPLTPYGASDPPQAAPDCVLDLRPLKPCRYFSDSALRNVLATRGNTFDPQAVTPGKFSDTPPQFDTPPQIDTTLQIDMTR
jgi:hypothetical protein